jgi:hypothetical protein
MLAAAGGLGIAYLGSDLPHSEIMSAAKQTEAKVLVLGIKAAISGKETLKELHRFSEELPESVEFWVGGVRSADLVREIKSTRGVYLKDLAVFERELTRLGARY